MKRIALGAALGLISACGLANGLKGSSDEPGGASTALTTLSWHGPVQIDEDVAPQADAPWLAWGQGAAWVSFYAYDASNMTASAWVTRRPRGGTFTRPVQVPTPSGWAGLAYPQIAIGASGEAAIAMTGWELNSNATVTNSSIWAARVDESLTVLQADLVRLDSSLATASSEYELSQNNSIAVGDSGEALVLFAGTPGGVYVASQALGSAWATPAEIAGSAFGGGLQIALGADDSALTSTAGPQSDGGSQSTYYALPLGLAGGGVTPGTARPVFTGYSGDVVVAARGDQGMAVVSGFAGSLDTFTLSDGLWVGEHGIGDAKLSGYIEPSVAMNSKGEAVLIWRDYDPGNTDSYSGTLQASFWDGGSWSPQQQISNAGTNPHAWWGKVDLNERGEAVAAWADFEPTGTYTRIYASILETNSGAPIWSAPFAVDQDSPDAGLANDPENVRYVGVALERDGGAAQIIWMQHEGDAYSTPRTWANWIEAP